MIFILVILFVLFRNTIKQFK